MILHARNSVFQPTTVTISIENFHGSERAGFPRRRWSRPGIDPINGSPQKWRMPEMDGFFHGKSEHPMDDDGVAYPDLGNLRRVDENSKPENLVWWRMKSLRDYGTRVELICIGDEIHIPIAGSSRSTLGLNSFYWRGFFTNVVLTFDIQTREYHHFVAHFEVAEVMLLRSKSLLVSQFI